MNFILYFGHSNVLLLIVSTSPLYFFDSGDNIMDKFFVIAFNAVLACENLSRTC